MIIGRIFFEKFFSSGRAAKARGWAGDTGYRLHVSPLNPRTKRRDIEKVFSKFGTINEVHSSFCSSFYFSFRKNLGLDGHESSLLRLCEFQTSR